MHFSVLLLFCCYLCTAIALPFRTNIDSRCSKGKCFLFQKLREVVREEYGNGTVFNRTESVEPSERKFVRLNKHSTGFLFDGDMLVSEDFLTEIVRETERVRRREKGENEEGSEGTEKREKRQAYKDADYPKTVWTDGVPFNITDEMPPLYIQSILYAISFWQINTCINFRERTNETSYVYFDHDSSGCYSSVGKELTDMAQIVNIGPGCSHFGITSHEVAHALGLFHHHQRYDRDKYIKFYPKNVPADLLMNFAKIPQRYLSTYDTPYDVGSVMHYTPSEFAYSTDQPALRSIDKHLQNTMGSMDMPSFLDVLLLNLHYNCTEQQDLFSDLCPKPPKCLHGGYVNPRNCSLCKCPTGFGGPSCGKIADSYPSKCGGLLMATTTLQKIEMGIKAVGERLQCNYHIRAPPKRRIVIGLATVDGWCVEGCYGSGVEIKGKRDYRPVGYRFCCKRHSFQRLVLHSRNVPVMFYATAGTTNITMYYRWISDSSDAEDAEIFDGSGNSTKPVNIHEEIFSQTTENTQMKLSVVRKRREGEKQTVRKNGEIKGKKKLFPLPSTYLLPPFSKNSLSSVNRPISYDDVNTDTTDELIDLSLIGSDGQSDIDFMNE